MTSKLRPYSNKGDLTTGPVRKHLIRLTIPMIWGILAVISLQLVDTYFISLLGTEELAGVSFTFPVTMIITHFVFGINIAMSSVVARLIGEKRMDDAKRVTLHGIIMAFSTSVTICILTFFLLEPLFTLMGADENTLPIIADYMPLWLIGAAIGSIPINGNSAIRASGDSLTPAIIMSTMALINLILDPILIFGWFGFPALGVTGAALATLIAYICCLGMGLYALIIKKKLLPADGLHLSQFTNSVRRLIHIAIPAGIANIVQPFTNAVIVALLATHSTEAVAAFGVVSRVEAFALLIVISLALGMGPIIGQNWGAKKFERVHETINTAIIFNFIWSALVAITMGLFAYSIAGLFSDNPDVIEYAVLFFWIVPFSYAFSNLVFGWGSAFNAMGMPQRSFVMIIVKSLVLTIPAIYIGSWLYGVVGIFVAMATVNLITGVVFHILSWRVCLHHEHQRQSDKGKA